MLMYTKTAAWDAVSFRIIERLGGGIMGESCFAQIVVRIPNIHEIWPFRGQKIEADRIDCHTVQRHENAARPGIVERRHLPFEPWWSICIAASIEAVDDKEHRLLTKILMTQEIHECGVACGTVMVGR